MKKPAKSSMEEKFSTKKEKKNSNWHEEYYRDMYSLKMHPVNDAYLLKLALEWVAFAKDDKIEALSLNEFYIHKGLMPGTVDRWMDRCEELKAAHAFSKMIIGARREKGAIQRKYSESMVKHSMPVYDVKWKELEEWRAKIQQKLDSMNNEQKIVVIERFAEKEK